MTRKCLMEKTINPPKYKVQHRNRCELCGRPRPYRICFRNLASAGQIPGVRKASW